MTQEPLFVPLECTKGHAFCDADGNRCYLRCQRCGALDTGGTLTVRYAGETVELEIEAHETQAQIAQRLADVLNGLRAGTKAGA